MVHRIFKTTQICLLCIISISVFSQKSQDQVDPELLKYWKFQKVLKVNDSIFSHKNDQQDHIADRIHFLNRYNIETTYDSTVVYASYKYDLSNKLPRIIIFISNGKEIQEVERFLIRSRSENEMVIMKGGKELLYSAKNLYDEKELPIEVQIELLNEYEVTQSKEKYKWAYPYSYNDIPGDSASQKNYDIEIKIKNTSDQPIFIWLMSCSWADNFIINNDYMHINRWDCDKNIPWPVKISPNKEKVLNATLLKDIKFDYPGNSWFGYGVETTRLGLIVSLDFTHNEFFHHHYMLSIEDKSKWNVVWSNALYLHKFPGGKVIDQQQ